MQSQTIYILLLLLLLLLGHCKLGPGLWGPGYPGGLCGGGEISTLDPVSHINIPTVLH